MVVRSENLGVRDENWWKLVETAGGNWRQQPQTTTTAKGQPKTDILMFVNNQYIHNDVAYRMALAALRIHSGRRERPGGPHEAKGRGKGGLREATGPAKRPGDPHEAEGRGKAGGCRGGDNPPPDNLLMMLMILIQLLQQQ